MNSLKRFAVTMLFRTKAPGPTRVYWLENVGLKVRNLTIFKKKSRNFQCVGRRFYSDLEETKETVEGSEGEDMDEDEIYSEMSTDEIFEEIASGDSQVLQKLKLLEFEIAILREQGGKVPDNLTKNQWLEFFEIESCTSRRKFLEFVRLNELKKYQLQRKSLRKLQLFEMHKKERGFHYYGLSGHTMFMRVYDKDVNRLLKHRLLSPQLEVLLDCSYQGYMNSINVRACAKQIFYCLTQIKTHRISTSLKLCNFNKSDALGKVLDRYVPGLYEQYGDYLYKESYLEMYPKEKLIYLTPHTRRDLIEVDPRFVYIIGAFVDKGTSEKVSLAKAKEDGLKMARFPIDEYLLWKQGTKSLPLNVALHILLEQAFYCDWYKSFKSLPSRCFEEGLE